MCAALALALALNVTCIRFQEGRTTRLRRLGCVLVSVPEYVAVVTFKPERIGARISCRVGIVRFLLLLAGWRRAGEGVWIRLRSCSA